LLDGPTAWAVRFDRHEVTDCTIYESDITARFANLVDFIEAVGTRYGFTREPNAIGFSNWYLHGGGAAPDPSKHAGGCHPVSAALTARPRSADPFEWYAGVDHRR